VVLLRLRMEEEDKLKQEQRYLNYLVLAEAIESIELVEEFLVLLVGADELLEEDDAVAVGVYCLHELADLLLDVGLLVRSELDLLSGGVLATTLFEQGALKDEGELLGSELAGALAVSEGERGSELGPLVSDTDAHEEEELREVHHALLVAAKETPDVLVHLALFLVVLAFPIEEAVPVLFVDNVLGVVVAQHVEGLLHLHIAVVVKSKALLRIKLKVLLVKRRQHTVLCSHL